MRFVITGEWNRNRLLQTIVLLYALYVAALWITNAGLYFSKMDLTYSSVVDYYLGSEESFQPPRSYQSLLEISHFHLFAMGMLLLVMTHLMLFVPLSNRTKAILIVVPFVAGILDEGSGWLIRFVSPGFAYLKIFGFLLLEGSLATLTFASVWAVLRGSPDHYEDGEEEP